MNWFSLVAIYFVVWWTVLFAVLPWGIRTQAEEGEMVLGTAESAPADPMLARKAAITSLVAAVIVGLLWLGYVEYGINIDTISNALGIKPVPLP